MNNWNKNIPKTSSLNGSSTSEINKKCCILSVYNQFHKKGSGERRQKTIADV